MYSEGRTAQRCSTHTELSEHRAQAQHTRMSRKAQEAKKSRELYNESQELESLQRVFDRLDKNGDKKIDADELFDCIKYLGYKSSKKEVQDMIWEVDEDCDTMLSWEEFKLMYQRVRADKTGWEPRRLFTMVEFMMHDKDSSGTIDSDECMEILFRRMGNDQVDGMVKEFMKQDIDGDNGVTFAEYLVMEKKSQDQLMRSHPSLRYSQSLVEDTKMENRRVLKGVAARGH